MWGMQLHRKQPAIDEWYYPEADTFTLSEYQIDEKSMDFAFDCMQPYCMNVYATEREPGHFGLIFFIFGIFSGSILHHTQRSVLKMKRAPTRIVLFKCASSWLLGR